MDKMLLEELNTELNNVYRYLVAKGVSHLDAEDAVQETAYKYLQFSETLKSSTVRNWLIRVALNQYYDQCRKNQKYILRDENILNVEKATEQPEQILIKKERGEEFYKLLYQMKPLHVELILLKYQSELSYTEIAKLLGIKYSSVKTNLYRARKKLLELYKEEENARE